VYNALDRVSGKNQERLETGEQDTPNFDGDTDIIEIITPAEVRLLFPGGGGDRYMNGGISSIPHRKRQTWR
jgi:hypothetical protein